MKYIKIPNCDESLFNLIRERILTVNAGILYNSEYLPDKKLGYFLFSDATTIPEDLMVYLVPDKTVPIDFSDFKLPKPDS